MQWIIFDEANSRDAMVLLLVSSIAYMKWLGDPRARRIKIIIMSATVRNSGSICDHLLAHMQQLSLRVNEVTVPRRPEKDNLRLIHLWAEVERPSFKNV